MAVKTFMHPRNIYKDPPNFKELAIVYPAFRKFVKQDLSGRVSIDFKDPNALRELTKTLLLKDFNLNVDIVETKLIPTLPLRLNYILWIEDLLSAAKINGEVSGVDIGTGASCIYPLLAAKRGWKMTGTEVDKTNFDVACRNIETNSLCDMISVRLTSPTDKLLVDVVESNSYDFCMCNPPFFSTHDQPKNRTKKRPEPKNAYSGTPMELKTEGGEIEFVKRIISDSQVLQKQIKIYSTMIGRKVDFDVLKNEIWKMAPNTYVTTEFCQGRTTRWGIAWTFHDFSLNKAQTNLPQKKKKTKAKLPLQHFVCSCETGEELQKTLNRSKELLSELKILYTEQEVDDKTFALTAKAYSNTWSHQRRKKREGKSGGNVETSDVPSESDDGPSPKRSKLGGSMCEPGSRKQTILLEFLMVVKEISNTVILEVSWLAGDSGREGTHQILQYIKNNWTKE